VALTTAGNPVPAPAEPAPRAGGDRVLVVDDNRDSADALAMVLQLEGFEVTVGYSGEEALRLAQQVQPRAVILDIGMPDLSGYEVARRLRAQPWGRDAFLLAMTGWGQAEDKQRARDAGFDRHLTKPLDPGELQRQLVAFFETPRPATGA
jgi:DNA-binding response OmpR family regulator